MDKASESWGSSLALREREVVTALLDEAESPGARCSKDAPSLTRDLIELDRIIAQRASLARPASFR